MIDEGAELHSHLASLGEGGLHALGRVLVGRRKLDALPTRLLAERPTSAVRDLSMLVAMAAIDEVVRLRLLRALRDLGAL